MLKSKRNKNGALKFLSFIVSIVMIVSSVPAVGFAQEAGSSREETFAVISGLSFVSQENRGGYNEAFLLDAKANSLQYEQLDGIIDSAFESVKQRVENDGLKYLLVNGDLTYNGEYNNHLAIAEKLKELEEKTGVQVIVAPGNKDIYNVNASTFKNGERENASYTSPELFKTVYADLGYDIAANVYRPSAFSTSNVSYSVELEGGYRLIVIDACSYNLNGIQYGSGDTAVHGNISDSLFEWIKSECTIAKYSGQKVIAMCHWNISDSSVFDSENMLQNADMAANVLADAGVNFIFTAGSGKNDISAVISDNGNVIYDVETSGLVSFPNTYRVCELKGSTGTFDIADADEVKNIVSRDGTEYEAPYRVTSSLKIQYADYDLARYCADIVKNYLSSILIPGVEANGTLEAFVKKQYGFSLTEKINELIGGGLNIMGILVIFDATNIMNMLEDVYQQAQSTLLKDPNTISDFCYNRFKALFDTVISEEKCTVFADTYGFGNNEKGGTVGELLLSMIAYSYYGNEDSSDDAFINDISKNLKTGELVRTLAGAIGDNLIEGLLFDDILSRVELKPQYLVFLDDTEDSIGSYLQIAFKAYLALHGEDSSVTGAVNSILKDGFFKEYGRSISEVIDYFINQYYSGKDGINVGSQLNDILLSYTYDSDPLTGGDFGVTYDGSKGAQSYASKENYRLPTMMNITFGNDTKTEAYVTWYTKSTVENSDIEIYDDENAVFYGKHFIGVEGANIVKSSEDIERTSYKLDLGFMSLGETTVQLTKHIIKITGLSAGKTYYFRVGDGSKNWWSDTASITTAADNENVTFIHVSDTQGNISDDFDIFDNILSCANSLYPETSFVLHTGGYVSDASNVNQWQMLLDGVSQELLESYFVPVAGEGESVDTITNNFAIGSFLSDKEQSGAYYSFDYNIIHVAVLDSNDIKEDGTLSDEQLEWFKDDMSKTGAKWKFVAIHNPVYTNGASSQDENYKNYMNNLTALMDEYDVDLVFSGQDCIYYRTDGMKAGAVSDSPTVSYPYYKDETLYYQTISDPSGTLYSALGASGAMAYESHEINNVSKIFAESGKKLNPDLPMFTAVEVEGDTLYLTTYTLEGNRATRVDKISIKKGATLIGDVNFDGKVTAADARLVLRSAAKMELLTASQQQVADANGDTKITAADARIILRIAAGLE